MRTLRYYDTCRIVSPSGRNTHGHRLYSADDIRRLRWVKPLQSMGLVREDLIEVLDLLAALAAGQVPAEPDAGAGCVADEAVDVRRALFARLAQTRLTSLLEETVLLKQLIIELQAGGTVEGEPDVAVDVVDLTGEGPRLQGGDARPQRPVLPA
jgi:DNA-binding transcriptional MerR regulator